MYLRDKTGSTHSLGALPKMPAVTRTKWSCKLKPRSQWSSLKRVLGTPLLEPSLLPSRVHVSGKLKSKPGPGHKTQALPHGYVPCGAQRSPPL